MSSPVIQTYPETRLRDILKTILDDYPRSRGELAPGHPFMNWFRRLGTTLPNLLPTLRDFYVMPEAGHSSNWSRVPYIQIRRIELSPKAGSGLALAYVFNTEGKVLYLLIYVEAADLSKSPTIARGQLSKLRGLFSDHRNLQVLTPQLPSGAADKFVNGCVLGVAHNAAAVPPEEELLEELGAFLRDYASLDGATVKAILSTGHDPEVSMLKPPTLQPNATAYTIDDLLRDTLMRREIVEDILADLHPTDKLSMPVILAGPPGTGKTWVAKRLIQYLTQGDSSRYKFVQFHPAYSYEQFVEGLQPDVENGQLTFRPAPGVLLRCAKTAASREKDRYFLIMDEMNRANLPRVFGELMTMLEYRDEPIDLAYTHGFTLPPNLAFIGTMNTADRSIRSIDLALRRRFDIFDFPADVDILERYYQNPENHNFVKDLFEGFTSLNELLEREFDKYHTVGQSYFMARSFTNDSLRRVWDRQLLPLLAEYFFDRPSEIDALSAERFWPTLE